MSQSPNKKRAILSWCLFDWANSAFPTLILTFIFASYFTKAVAVNDILGTAQWGDAFGLAGLIIAIISPIFGAIADHEGRRKPWLLLFTIICIAASAMLWFTKPDPSDVSWALTWMVIGTIGFEVGMVFYNAMLSDLVPQTHVGRLSGWAWGFGYFGGLVSLIIMLFVFQVNTTEEIRLTGPFAAVWFALFAWPLFRYTPDRIASGVSHKKCIERGLKSLFNTLLEAHKHKEVFKFLIARILYIDGLNTIFAFGGIYAAGTFGMSFSQIIAFGIAMNIAAGIGAIAFAWMDDLKGSKPTLIVSLLIMIVCGSAMLTVHSQTLFWVFGLGLSLCVGPTQAASRSLLIRLSPKHLITGMFGLYAFSGKATSFLGPWILASITLAFNSQRIGMSTVIVFLALGAALLWFVKEHDQ
ncbi:MAG: MFS transporter [Coxiellaceae bacterium]|nr:MFS transporter [Coxiellaceae bacterium]